MSTTAQRQAAGHDVIFAEGDAELVAVAGERLVRAHAYGATLVVIATPAHRRLFGKALAAAAVDVGAARGDGSLVELDAAETLAALLSRGAFDRAAFDDVVGTVVHDAAGRGAVHAFGEMVGLLWADGRVEDAIELEVAWNDLLDQTPAELLCGYASTVADDHASSGHLHTVCRLHSQVVAADAFDRTWHFGSETTMARVARRIVTGAMRARGLAGGALNDAQILLGELVANAVRHARTPFSVSLSIDDARIVLAVRDDSGELPVLAQQRAADDPSGRGLHLVDALARRWAVEPDAGGKVVWAEMGR